VWDGGRVEREIEDKLAGLLTHMVNPIVDGMNLVAKEGPVVNERDGVLILSEGAGASEELGEAALIVSPYDLVDMAEAMHQALETWPKSVMMNYFL